MKEDSVLHYISRTVEINFTDSICCARCPLLETYARKQCRKTGEYIMDDRIVGGWCPLADPETGEPEGAYIKNYIIGGNHD